MAGPLKIGDNDDLDFIQSYFHSVFLPNQQTGLEGIYTRSTRKSVVNASYAEIEICNVRGVKYHELAAC